MSDTDYESRFGDPRHLESGWNGVLKAIYLPAYENGTLKMEKANISFSDDSGTYHNVAVVRFRIATTAQERIARKILPFDTRYQWQYIILSDDHNSVIRNTPISAEDAGMVLGELAEISDNLFVFETRFIPTYEVLQIFVSPQTAGQDQYSAIIAGVSCVAHRAGRLCRDTVSALISGASAD